jgi:P-type Cu2+ transporter
MTAARRTGHNGHPHGAAGAAPHPHAEHREPALHDKHAGHSVEMFRRKLWGTVLLSVPTLVWAPMIQQWLGYEAWGGPEVSRWISAFFGTLVFAYGGSVFVKGAIGELADRRPGMMTLIALAITVSFVFSLAVTFGFPGMDLWWELATLITIMVLGHWIEMRSISQAQGALRQLATLLPDTALRVVGERTESVPVSALRMGDLVLVRPGASVPADGLVREGSSDVNESMITGESRPVRKDPQSAVIAGTVNGSGSLRVEVTGTGEKTALAGIMRLVAQAQNSRSRAQALADRAAFLLTIVAVVAAAFTLVGWFLAGQQAAFVIERVVTVLVIACPHALGLAIPLVVAISTTLGARNGLLVRDRRGLEEARNVTAVFFDKTGTLTRGEFRVVEITTREGVTHDEALALASAVERDSSTRLRGGSSGARRTANSPSRARQASRRFRGTVCKQSSTAGSFCSAARPCSAASTSRSTRPSAPPLTARRRAVRPPSQCSMEPPPWRYSRSRTPFARNRARPWSACMSRASR